MASGEEDVESTVEDGAELLSTLLWRIASSFCVENEDFVLVP